MKPDWFDDRAPKPPEVEPILTAMRVRDDWSAVEGIRSRNELDAWLFTFRWRSGTDARFDLTLTPVKRLPGTR